MIGIFFLIGTCMGSFICLLSNRVPKNIDFVFKKSFCDNCGENLSNINMIPIVSYILLKGKARCCNKGIPIRSTLLEIICGIFFALTYYIYGTNIFSVKIIFVFMIILFSTIIDIEFKEIYILPIVIAIGILFVSEFDLVNLIMIMILIAIYNAIRIFNFPFGQGDIAMYALCFILIGKEYWFKLFLLSFVFGAVISIILIIFKVYSIKDTIPFVPFILLSFIFVVLT